MAVSGNRFACVWLPGWHQREPKQGRSHHHEADHEEAHHEEAREELARWCQQFSPLVGCRLRYSHSRQGGQKLSPAAIRYCDKQPWQRETIWMNVTNIGALFGGESGLVRQILGLLRKRRIAAYVAIAPTAGSAWALSRYVAGCHSTGAPRYSRQALESHHGPTLIRVGKESCGIVASHAQVCELVQSLPIASLRLTPETQDLLVRLGVRQVSEVLELPREELAQRISPELVIRAEELLGNRAEQADWLKPATVFRADRILANPLNHQQHLLRVLVELLEQVVISMVPQNRGILSLVCHMENAQGEEYQLPVGLFRPTLDIDHLASVLQLQLSTGHAVCEVIEVSLEVTRHALLEQKQMVLPGMEDGDYKPSEHPRELLSRMVDRLSSRLGSDRVLKARRRARAAPEAAFDLIPLAPHQVPEFKGKGRGAKSSGANSGNRTGNSTSSRDSNSSLAQTLHASVRPLWLWSEPTPLNVEVSGPGKPPIRFYYQGNWYEVARYWGPERIETGWWYGRVDRREYYRLETTRGGRFWVYRQIPRQQWMLQGVF
ncbi:MAG: hypothetical protein MK329_08550 [Pirellulales bacterium]|nr:hypothetical protein [Pirellulales bacterium]